MSPSLALPDLAGRTILVTGANAGIGYWCAEILAGHGARVLLGCRSTERAEVAASSIRAHAPGADLGIVPLDLGSLVSITAAAASIGERIDAVICNAGVKAADRGARTADGLDLMVGTNFVGHFALIARLGDVLADDARVVAVGSLAHRFAEIDPATLAQPWTGPSLRQYGRSKAALMAFAFELNRRWRGSARSALCAHPGYAVDPLTPHRDGLAEVSTVTRALAALSRPLVQGKDAGAAPIVHAAVAADATGGDYWGPGGLLEFRGAPRRVAASAQVRSVDVGAELWSVAEHMAGVRFRI
ncbi:NAD(P)-dependent dehydrogenase (short-subunit alcohol dehydrogenase family) [Microbacterium foliorum]|uniref:NAD(P)-dependent dehydrogenase (Short-subunit alcohol dehydrogenase family) n=1 Tax=Microbacterium foliorum TaxID=104336 RepID=A0ABU1HVA6_9MICO|nr:SDR family NAD(P)-dependent oxidoreductase [Microbacterium foliorum]MDR6143219.1 NAD(P)-dependent dehydrogenase (short-subunit alcohol dehydrogenase family) [Microbacterium foliorum]